MSKPLKLFISYSHDSDEHCQKVLSFANKLCDDGYGARIDQHIADPPEGWPLWMDNGINDADFVLLICTETYKRRVMGKEESGIGFGGRFEGKVVYNLIHNNASRNEKFLPVLFHSADRVHIPNLLSGDSCYLIESAQSYDKLLQKLQDKHRAKVPDIGDVREVDGVETPDDFFSLLENKATSASNSSKAQSNFHLPDVVELSHLPSTTTELFGRESELIMLDEAWENPQTRIISLIAWGGVGKTSLVNKWLDKMSLVGFRGAQRVFGYSFYSQGTSDARQVSAATFINAAFRWLDYQGEIPNSDHDKGVLLAQCIAKQKCLLVLDGLEPMQHPPGKANMGGLLKEQSLSAMLKNLAFTHSGLVLITSRIRVKNLENREKSVAPVHALENLSIDAGVKLLINEGIKGPKKALQQAVKELDGHALALALMGSYLYVVHEGDIYKRDTIPALTEDENQGGHAKRVIASYANWFAQQGENESSIELNILSLLGLFDRPLDYAVVDWLIKQEPIAGVTEQLNYQSDSTWKYALQRLQQLKLISESNQNQQSHSQTQTQTQTQILKTLDCHPLIREYFAKQLQDQNPDGFIAAHSKLYEYYKNLPEKEFPDTLEEMEPLFMAVAHGCKAGLHQQALHEVYWLRVQRKAQHYTIKRLGAFGADLACIANFFQQPWSQSAPELTDADKAAVLNWAASRLRGLGRLLEAIEPFKAGLAMQIAQEDYRNASAEAGTLSELLLSLGQVNKAVEYGRQAMEYADLSEDEFQKESKGTTYADALLQRGKRDDIQQALALFQQAEQMQQQRLPEYYYLYSLWGGRYCDLLLGQGKWQEVIKRATTTLEWAKQYSGPLDQSLDALSLGIAYLTQAKTTENVKGSFSVLEEAKQWLDTALEELRKAGTQHRLPLGLLARAEFYTYQKQHVSAWQDLDEVFEIADYSCMLLHLTNYHLQAGFNIDAQLKQAQLTETQITQVQGVPEFTFIVKQDGQVLQPSAAEMHTRLAQHYQEAKRLINQTGYHRRDKELSELQEMLNECYADCTS